MSKEENKQWEINLSSNLLTYAFISTFLLKKYLKGVEFTMIVIAFWLSWLLAKECECPPFSNI